MENDRRRGEKVGKFCKEVLACGKHKQQEHVAVQVCAVMFAEVNILVLYSIHGW